MKEAITIHSSKATKKINKLQGNSGTMLMVTISGEKSMIEYNKNAGNERCSGWEKWSIIIKTIHFVKVTVKN